MTAMTLVPREAIAAVVLDLQTALDTNHDFINCIEAARSESNT